MKAKIEDISKGEKLRISFVVEDKGKVISRSNVLYPLDTTEEEIKGKMDRMLKKCQNYEEKKDEIQEKQEKNRKAIETVEKFTNYQIEDEKTN